MSLVDPGAAALVRAFRRRTPRRPPDRARSARDPMFRRSGSSFDLKNIREYGPADDPRRIDWKLEARTGRLFVKEYFDEERDGIALLVDLSSSLEVFGDRAASRIGASLAWILGALGLPTSLLAFAEAPIRRLERPRGSLSPAPIEAFFEGLEAVGEDAPRRGTDIGAALGAARRAGRHRRAIVISDFFDGAWKPTASPFSRNFYLRLYRSFEELGPGSGEVEVEDPETGRRFRTPWDAKAKDEYRGRERALEASFGEATRRGAFYRLVTPGSDRAGLYWELLEALYA